MSSYDKELAKSLSGKGSDGLANVAMGAPTAYGRRVVAKTLAQRDGFRKLEPKGSIIGTDDLVKSLQTLDRIAKSDPGDDELVKLQAENDSLRRQIQIMRRMLLKPAKSKPARQGDQGGAKLAKSEAMVGAQYRIASTGKRVRLDRVEKDDQGVDRYVFRVLQPAQGEALHKWLDETQFREHMEAGRLVLDAINAEDYKPPKNPQAFGNTSGEGLN